MNATPDEKPEVQSDETVAVPVIPPRDPTAYRVTDHYRNRLRDRVRDRDRSTLPGELIREGENVRKFFSRGGRHSVTTRREQKVKTGGSRLIQGRLGGGGCGSRTASLLLLLLPVCNILHYNNNNVKHGGAVSDWIQRLVEVVQRD